MRQFNELSASGFGIVIDDIGTGFASLNQLNRFPISKLKIDRAFVDNLVSDSRDQVIVDTVVRLASGLNVRLVAEGVETRAQLEVLNSLGCESFQGYLFSRPLSSVAFAEKYLSTVKD